jgi:hypothetical protein
MRIDHLMYAVADLEETERRFAADHGLRATGSGEHPEFGTRNRIVPVGPGQYIELMAVGDDGSGHPLARAVAEAAGDGGRPLALCLRPDDLDTLARRLSLEIRPGERHNPGGEVLRWRLAGIEAALGPERLPFFIDWQGAEGRLDRQHGDAAVTNGIEWVEYGADRARLAEWVGADEVPLRMVEGEPGPHAIGLRRGAETIVVR